MIKESRIYFSVFFMFGLIMAVAGVAGLTLGSGLSFWLRPKYRGVDPLICGGGLVPSSILILVSFVIAEDNIWAAYILVFFGQVFLNMNWAVIVDMTLVRSHIRNCYNYFDCRQQLSRRAFYQSEFHVEEL